MVRILKRLDDNTKQEVLENAGHKCQCNYHHTCVTGVGKNSWFVTNIPPQSEFLSYDNIKVLCKPCIDKGHHLHLEFPTVPAVKIEDLFKPKNSSGK